MHSNIHAHVPSGYLSEYMEYLVSRHINPEISLQAESLDQMVWEKLSAQANQLLTEGLTCTIHAPFLDLNPGALDRSIRQATRHRFSQVFQAAELLKPRVIVFHPGYDDLRYGNSRLEWLKNSIDFWREFVCRADEVGCTIAIENIFEKEPSTIKALLEEIDHPRFRHCFDVGHWNMFSTVRLEEWFEELGTFIAECHIHDNHGQGDEHLPPGEGQIDFDLLFGLLKHYVPQAAWTIETHSRERLERAMKYVEAYL